MTVVVRVDLSDRESALAFDVAERLKRDGVPLLLAWSRASAFVFSLRNA